MFDILLEEHNTLRFLTCLGRENGLCEAMTASMAVSVIFEGFVPNITYLFGQG